MRAGGWAPWMALAMAGALWLPATVDAQTVIYRCTDAKGALTVQNDTPCPKGSKQEKRVIDGLPTGAAPAVPTVPRPAPVPAPTPAAPAKAKAPAEKPAVARPRLPDVTGIADGDRLPPPPIFQCNTWDNDSYISESADPQPRCVRLQTTGVGGLQQMGAGAACEMKTDQCQRVPDGAACAGWRKRANEVEASWRHARAPDKAALQEEFARVARILQDSTCGT